MEEKIENYVDSSLEGFAPFLYKLNVVGGILLIILGIFITIKNKNNPKERMKVIGMITIGIGVLAFFSGMMQIVL